MEYIEVILKGFITGLLAAYLVLYSLRPAVPHPEFILELFENLWMFIILIILNYYTFMWDYTIGAILLLCIIALIFDYVVFTNKGFKKIVKNVKTQDHFYNFTVDEEPSYVPLPEKTKEKSMYNVIINDIQNLMGDVFPGQPTPVS
jgi:competence protein ComGC